MTLGEREQFTQIEEPFDDDFLLADLNVEVDLGDGKTLTSITSYTDRDVTVVRDAGALYASIAGGSIGLPPPVYTLDAPLDDNTTAEMITQELRIAGETDEPALGRRRVLQHHGPRLRPEPADRRLHPHLRHPQPRPGGADSTCSSTPTSTTTSTSWRSSASSATRPPSASS